MVSAVPASDAAGQTHLTNYSLNEQGERLMLPELKRRLRDALGAAAAETTWKAVDDLIVKTVLSVEGTLHAKLVRASRRVAGGAPNTHCFELLGFDVMLDDDGRPWLLEVNLDPSLSTEDVRGTAPGANAHLKGNMLADLLDLVGITLPPRVSPTAPIHHAPQTPASPGMPPDNRSQQSSGASRSAEAAEAEYRSAAASRRLSQAEARTAAQQHVDAEFERSRSGGWRRLLPSPQSEFYAQFIAEERRAMNLLPFTMPPASL